MKRTALLRRSELKRTKPLRSRPRRRPAEADPVRHAYKEVVWGHCAVCGAIGFVRRHHVTYEQHVRVAGGDRWDPRNSMWVGVETLCDCHGDHHRGLRHNKPWRISFELISEAALAFCVDLFGDKRAAEYLRRYYDCSQTVQRAGWFFTEVDGAGWAP